MMTKTDIRDTDDMIDSRDIIERLAVLTVLASDSQADDEELAELAALVEVEKQAKGSPDWEHGEQLIRDSYFMTYVQELVDDCFEQPKGHDESAWPWRHRTMDWEAAAEELKADYFDVEFRGVTDWVRG